MSVYYSEREACDKYKQAIRDHREELEALLYPQPWAYLKSNHCLTEQEIEDIKSTSSGLRPRIKRLLDHILNRTDVVTLCNFCKTVYSKNHTKGLEIFPFADSLGGLPVISPGKDLPSLPSGTQCVLWLVPSEADHKKVLTIVSCTPNGAGRLVGNYTCREYLIIGEKSSRTVHIAYPTTPSSTNMRDPVHLLHQFTPRPHLLVTTGTCCANVGEAHLGDVCVVRPGSHQPSLMAEIEHMVEIWRLEKSESLIPDGVKPPRSVHQQMVCLARINHERQLPEGERSSWYQELQLDSETTSGSISTPGVRRCITDPDSFTQTHKPRCQGSPEETEALSSIIFASQDHSFISDPVVPRVLFGRASRFKQSQGTLVCSPQTADIYKAALVVNSKLENSQSSERAPHEMAYLAVLGVSAIDGWDYKEEEEYEQFTNISSIHIMWKIICHLFIKIHV